jgi:hypothetical protein
MKWTARNRQVEEPKTPIAFAPHRQPHGRTAASGCPRLPVPTKTGLHIYSVPYLAVCHMVPSTHGFQITHLVPSVSSTRIFLPFLFKNLLLYKMTRTVPTNSFPHGHGPWRVGVAPAVAARPQPLPARIQTVGTPTNQPVIIIIIIF